MSVITREDKNNNIIEFSPLDKRYRYKVNGETKRGVTTLIGARFGKAPLMNWAKDLPIRALQWQLENEGKSKDYIFNFIDSLKKKVDELEIKDATTGTLMHSYCEDYINGKKVVPPTTEPLITMYGKFTKWWDSKDYKVLATEQTCYSKDLDVCGTFDVVVKNKKGKVLLLDFKTSKDFYPDMPIQIHTYKKLVEDSTDLKVEFLAVINIPKEPVKDVEMRIFQIKPKYLKCFKACKYLNSLEEDFKQRNLEYNKQRSN